jgi:hypothetical protein
MKPFCFLILALLLNCGSVCAQELTYSAALKTYTADFKKAEGPADYQSLITKLQRLTKAYPDSAEAHYLLAYCYNRYNSGDGNGIPGMKLPLVLKASAELEKVISLTPKYKGDLIALDPYSKITSEWGCMALAYLNRNKKDSTLWAFQQGKKRGGFGDHTLSFCRAALDKCSKGAILVSSGDIFTLPLYYLQLSEGIRTDVSIVDIGLVSSIWYPQFLTRLMAVKTGLTASQLKNIDYEKWTPANVKIPIRTTAKFFSWRLKPSYENEYLLSGDTIFLAILKTNKFNRDIYFTKAFTEGDRLSLGENLLMFAACDKLNVNHVAQLTFEEYLKDAKDFIASLKPAGTNSDDELMIVNCLRYDIIDKLEKSIESGDAAKKAELLKLLNSYLPEAKFPYTSEEVKDYIVKLTKE